MIQQNKNATLVKDTNGKTTALIVKGRSFPFDENIFVPKAYWDDIQLSLLPISNSPDRHRIVTVESECSGAPLEIYYGVEREDDSTAFVHFACILVVSDWAEPMSAEKYMDVVFRAIDSRRDVTDRSLKMDSDVGKLWFNIDCTATHLGEVRDIAEKVIADVVKKANAENSALKTKSTNPTKE